MSSGFVSGGSLDAPIERDEAWAKAEQELEEARKRKAELAKQQSGGKSLFETLQANKAAKQDAFEESIRLKNQFRALDDDEADFLDTVLESQREKERAVKKETAEQLAAFRKLRDDADRGVLSGAAPSAEGEGAAPALTGEVLDWAVSAGRKRKTGERDGLRGLKVRRTTGKAGDKGGGADAAERSEVHAGLTKKSEEGFPAKSPVVGSAKAVAKPVTSGLGLAAYSSDEEDD